MHVVRPTGVKYMQSISTEEEGSVTEIASDSLAFFTLKEGKLLEPLCIIVSLKLVVKHETRWTMVGIWLGEVGCLIAHFLFIALEINL